ncbi:uncharacterized protein LOC144175474 [Haemaphysalis longicornis]
MYVNIYANVEDYPADPSMPSQGPQEECNVCGEGHATAACPLLGLAQKVDDKSVPSRARLSLPPTLALVDNADGEPRVTAREDIPVGTQFGPVEAPRYRAFKGNPRFKLKVFPTKGRATCLDTSDEYQCNWMCFVEPAPEPSVQNLIAYQLGQDIYFSVQRPVGCGDTLYVGYAPPYGRRMAGPVEEPALAAVPAATEFPTEPGGPPAKRKRGRPPRSAQMTRPTKVTIVSKTGAGQGVPPGTVVNVRVVSGESPADERQQQQWTCSQCGRLYRDSVVFARHLQDHYRPAYLKELSGRMRGGRPRPPLRPPPPATGLAASADNIQSEDVQQDVAMLQETASEKVDGAELSRDIAEGQLAIQADGPVAGGAAVSQVEAALDDGSHTQVLIQLQDGSIHEILSFDASVSLPGETMAVVGEQQQQETNPVEDNASGAVAPIAVTTLNQLQHFAASQDAVVAVSGEAATPPQLMTAGSGGGARRGRKPKSSGASRSADVLPTRRFTEVERQSAGKYNLRTTRKALVVDDEENAEDDSDYEGDDLSDYESGCEGEYASGLEPGQMLGSSEQPVTIQLAGPLVASAMEEGSAMPSGGEEATAGTGGVPQELHVAVEMLTSSLPCQSGEQAGTPQLPAVSVSESLSAVISETLAAETTSGAEATATREPMDLEWNLHGEKRFQCDMCGKRFHRKDLLLEHHAVHGDPTFPCPTCRKLFKTKKSLDVHMMIHTGVKRFKCSVCAKEFFQKGNLQKHEDTHLSERRHRCAVCQKVFATRESLARHALEHTRGRLFPCAQCGRAFVKEHQLRNHQRVFHSDQLYSCRFCGLSLKLRHSLKRHLRKKHPDREHQWGSPGALTAMLVSKVPDGTELGSDMGLDPDAVEESLQHAAESATNPSVAGFEVAFEGDHMGGGSALSSAADSDMVQDTSGSIVANVMGEHGSSEVLLAVEGLSSEELREAIASGRAQIKQGPTPDTIEISMPFDAADEGGPQVTYMANLVDPTDQVVVDDGSSVMATDQPDVLEGSEAALGRPMSGHYVVSEEGGSSELAEGMAATGSLEEHAAVRSLQDPSAVAAQLDSLGATDATIKKHFGSSLVTFRPIMTAEEQAAEADATAGDGDTSEVVPTVASDLPTDLAYEEPQFVVTEEQEVGDDTHVIYNAGDSLHEQPAMPQGTIVLDDGTILQQDDQQGNPTDLLLYVLTTSDTQDG